jgi:colanic acid biosynthesis glycosyl transferase WcaI
VDIEIKADAVAVQGVPQQLRVSSAADDVTVGLPPLANLLAGKHVVVVGINYAPEPTGIAPYTTAMCEHLATRARLVTVLTGLPHYPSWQVPAAYRGFRRNPEQHTPTLHVLRHKHYVPGRMSALTRAGYEASFLHRVSLTQLDSKPDLVIAVTPSLSGAVAGARLAKKHGCTLVVIVQDLMAKAASQSGISGGGAVAGSTARLERKALAAADRVLIVSEAFRPQLHEYGISDDRIDLVPNWSHITPSTLTPAEAKKALGWPAGRFTVVHTGNIGFKQGLTTVIEAAAELDRRQEPVDLVFVGDGSQRKALQVMAKDLRHVRFVDPVGEDEYPTLLAAADLLLLSERPSVTDMSLPSKLTSYLMAGRPVLASVAGKGATARELARVAGGAQLVDAGKSWDLADAIAVLRHADERRAAMARSAQKYAQLHLSATGGLRRLETAVSRVVTPG